MSRNAVRVAMTPRRLGGAVLTAALLSASAIAFTSPHALASGTAIGPHQYFIGLVNGSAGRSAPVVIRMACFGAITPGQTGHPFAGQTLAVRQVKPSKHAGMTGDNTNSIGVFFGTLPPSSGGPSSTGDFSHYGKEPLSTSLTLPCAGTENVNFVPIPVQPSRFFAVPVVFEGQP